MADQNKHDGVSYYNKINQLEQLDDNEKNIFSQVEKEFAFRSNSYYNSLINWEDKNDPLRRIIVPDASELIHWGELDASKENLYQPMKGIEHKYQSTALLLCSDVCGAYCRFCFRKRLFQSDNDEVEKNMSKQIDYIKNNSQINNVLLTGGDPLMLSTARLAAIFESLSNADNVKIIRIGTKMLGFNPFRILDDLSLVQLVEDYSKRFQIFFMLHYNHPKEVTPESIDAIKRLKAAGANTVNQTPIIRGVNDNVDTLVQLFNCLAYNGVLTYYVFNCRPTLGNSTYAVPVEEGFGLFSAARNKISSGLSKTARYIISHAEGKIEVIGTHENKIIMRKHNFADSTGNESLMIFNSNPEAYWLDDYMTHK